VFQVFQCFTVVIVDDFGSSDVSAVFQVFRSAHTPTANNARQAVKRFTAG
jgi:hypothetical protein